MKTKCIILLPVFLCFAFLFRMCFLSFGSIYSPTVSYHSCIGFKRKPARLENGGSPDFKNHLNNLRKTPMSELQASKSRCILNKKISVSFLSLASCIDFLHTFFSLPKANYPHSSGQY